MSRKVYLVTDEDLETLRLRLDRNPDHGYNGGSGRVLSDEEAKAFDEAHRFYNYQIHKWISEVSG